eukprot:4616575-Alexandrium_andersonii.AAC.1
MLGWTALSVVSHPPRNRPGAGWIVAGVPHSLGDSWRIKAVGHLDPIEITRTGRGPYRPPTRVAREPGDPDPPRPGAAARPGQAGSGAVAAADGSEAALAAPSARIEEL